MVINHLALDSTAQPILDFLTKISFDVPPECETDAFVGHNQEQKCLFLPKEYGLLEKNIEKLNFLPAFSSFSIACLLHLAVTVMPEDQSYLNIGVWQGYTFFAGLMEHPHKSCIGVDNFSEFESLGSPRARFYQDFARFSVGSSAHQFYELDYQVYFETRHQGRIGVYFYDAAHTYQDQLVALKLADPFLASGALVFVDDANQFEVQAATQDFLAEHANYVLLASLKTAHNGHPSFWNGLLILQKTV